MTRTLTLDATVTFAGGTLTLAIDDTRLAALDAEQRRAALVAVQDTVGLMLELAAQAKPPLETPLATLAEPVTSEKAPTRKATRKRPAKSSAPRPAGGSKVALLRTIEAHDGTFEGSLAELANATPSAGTTDGARKQGAAQLAKTDLVHVTRDGRRVTSLTISAAGRALLADGAVPNTEPAKPRPTPEPEPEDDVDPAEDLAWATNALDAS